MSVKLSFPKINPIMYRNNDIEAYFPSHLFYVKIWLMLVKSQFWDIGLFVIFWYFNSNLHNNFNQKGHDPVVG
jgi:hypothetical protein